MGGAPGFFAPGGHGVGGGQVVEGLEGVTDIELALVFAADRVAERVLHVAADHEDHAVEAGAAGVEDRVIDHPFPAGADGVDLFQATIAAAHTGGEDHEGFVHGVAMLLKRG